MNDSCFELKIAAIDGVKVLLEESLLKHRVCEAYVPKLLEDLSTGMTLIKSL